MPQLAIFHTNDFHDRLDEERLRRLLPAREPYLLVDSGDAIRGSNTYFKWEEPILETMNRLGYHAMAMGNREFHYVRWVIRRRAMRLRFPILAANLVDLTGAVSHLVKSFVLQEHAGIPVGLFGLTVPQYPEGARVELLTRFRFLDSVKAARLAVAGLKALGARLIILLSHLGIQRDQQLAREVEGIHLILGGHSHTLLPAPVAVGDTLITQAGAYGKFLGRIDLELDPEALPDFPGTVRSRILPVKEEFTYEIALANRKKSILFLSNGYGEDTIAATVQQELRRAADVNLLGFPLVGEGGAYRQAGVPVAAPCRMMPSGGISGWTNLRNFFEDCRAGLLGLIGAQARALRDLRWKVDLVVAVGDLLPVAMAQLFLKRPVVFIGTAKSNWVSGYSRIEHWFMRRCLEVFPRDEGTMRTLTRAGIPARYVGNAMMDCLETHGVDLGIEQGEIVVAILPGSRRSAYEDFPVMAATMEELARREGGRRFRFLVAVPNSLDLDRLLTGIPSGTWDSVSETAGDLGPAAGRAMPAGPDPAGVVARYRFGEGITVLFIKGYFSDILTASRLVIGQAGTGNEQAAGLGKPVVAFDSFPRHRLPWYRRRQKKLLGDAVVVVQSRPDVVAREVMDILNNPVREQAMRTTGEQRMGPPGAAARMAAILRDLVARHA